MLVIDVAERVSDATVGVDLVCCSFGARDLESLGEEYDGHGMGGGKVWRLGWMFSEIEVWCKTLK